MSIQVFVKPYDIFMPRGNSHFGVSSGDFGQIRMLPAPSIFAGAFRSFLASRNPSVLNAIMAGKKPEAADYAKVLGSLEEPGSFRIKKCVYAKKTGKILRQCFLYLAILWFLTIKTGWKSETLYRINYLLLLILVMNCQ